MDNVSSRLVCKASRHRNKISDVLHRSLASNKSKQEPISLHNTARARAAAKLRPINGAVFQANDSSIEQPTVSHPMRGRGTGRQQESMHAAHHYMNGGMPCDPASPPYYLADYGEDSLYTLVLLRHGESEWNLQNLYTGWCDVDLTDKGRREARTAGRLLAENGIDIDHAFTSVLKRASFSCNMALNTARQHWVPVTKTWRLNERHYGALQGYNKDTAFEQLGLDQELVMQMRRSYGVAPPRMENDHPYWHGNDRRYSKLRPDQVEASRAESLKGCAARIMPFFDSVIVPTIRAGNKTLIVSHANTIRTLIKHIDGISDEDIKGMTIPTGIPMLYRLDENLKPVDPQIEQEFRYMVEPKGYTWGTSRAHGFHGVYLGDLERLQDIQKKRDVSNRDWQRIILRNIGQSFGWDMDSEGSEIVVDTRDLWWAVHSKMQNPDYSNMLLLSRATNILEDMMQRQHRYMTKQGFDAVINKIHLDAEGHIIEPFLALTDSVAREQRQRVWIEKSADDLLQEALIR